MRITPHGIALLLFLTCTGCGDTASEPRVAMLPQSLVAPPASAPSSVPHPGRSVRGTPHARFAATHQSVRLAGYDSATKMIEFSLGSYVSGGPNNGHYDDPASGPPRLYRLAMATAPVILSASSLCSDHLTLDAKGQANQPCTIDELIAALRSGVQPLARLSVDLADHITRIEELYQP